MTIHRHRSRRRLRRALAPLACALALGAAAQAAPAAQPGGVSKASASATLEQCVTAVAQSERSATFVGEMTAVPGTARMQMRIEVLEKMPREAAFHAIAYPGLGAWLRASAGVKTYKNFDKVTDLAAPAVYRASMHFRWLNARGRQIKSLELRTPRCQQPAAPASAPAAAIPATSVA
jgi:hypothetical protein